MLDTRAWPRICYHWRGWQPLSHNRGRSPPIRQGLFIPPPSNRGCSPSTTEGVPALSLHAVEVDSFCALPGRLIHLPTLQQRLIHLTTLQRMVIHLPTLQRRLILLPTLQWRVIYLPTLQRWLIHLPTLQRRLIHLLTLQWRFIHLQTL